MTIGELINELKKCKPDAKVYYDFAELMPTTINSWRGTYDEPALGWVGSKYWCGWGLDDPPTVENLLKELDLALQLSYTGEQLKNLKERRDEIITVAMGKCWHISTDGYYCDKCGAYILDEDSVHTIPNPDYSTPEGWFELYNWLTKEKPVLIRLKKWWTDIIYYAEEMNPTEFEFIDDAVKYFVDNLPDLFVQWLVETETGWWEECRYCKGTGMFTGQGYKTQCFCGGDKVLTPLGKLMMEVLDEGN